MKPAHYLILGVLTALVSLLFIPPLFGIIAIYCGYKLRKSDKTVGLILIILAIIFMVVGIIFGAYIGAQNYLNGLKTI